MLKGRGRDPRTAGGPAPAHLAARSPAQAPPAGRQPTHSVTHLTIRTPTLPRAPLAKPEPDYEVVEFPSDQYVNAKLQPPPPPPPRPPTGHPAEAASCGLCGGGGARVRCTECGRRALCASCDDMYHRHPKRRHHQRQALSLNQMRDERPPLPPKGTPPVPPPRRHKISGDRMSASPRPPSADPRNSALPSHPVVHTQTMPLNNRMVSQNVQQIPAHFQGKLPPASPGGHLGSMPYLPAAHHAAPAPPLQANTLGHLSAGWQRPRGSLTGFNMPPNPNMQMASEAWEAPEMVTQSWGRPLRRGASVLELGGGVGAAGGACGGCAQCASGWRYGSCASLDHQAWAPAPGWPPPACCHPQMHPHAHPPPHMHAPYTPQPYRRADSRAASRVASRAGSRAASPAVSVRSRASRRTKHRTPSPPPLPSSDADSESESDTEHPPPKEKPPSLPASPSMTSGAERANAASVAERATAVSVARVAWQCEHCTFVNEAGVRVCAVCCRTPTAAPRELAPDHRDPPRDTSSSARSHAGSPGVADSVRGVARLDLGPAPSPPAPAPAPAPARQTDPRTYQNGETTRTVQKKERVSTGCGPSPPREETSRKPTNRLVTPTREQSVEPSNTRHDMAVGPSPPKEMHTRTSVARSPPRQSTLVRASPYREPVKQEPPARHSVSVGPSPPRENFIPVSNVNVQKKSTGTSPPRERERVIDSRASSTVGRSTTGTSPPPQSISTQTYEVPSAWERAPSAARARARRRLRDDARRERSHSRHSLSSDTRESERTSGGGGGSSGRWEWRETRDSSPGAEWSGSERRPPPRLARRASHLDLRRERAQPRRSSYYRSEAASPEPTRAMSLEALATASGANAAAASRGLELARLMADAERLGFSAAEVQAALAQSPAAPLAWLRSRWPSLCAGVRAAAARLAPRAAVTELEARAALARHRGAMWPAVTDCVERHRAQTGAGSSAERRHGGRVWGSPAGADDDAAPPRRPRAEDSSDEFDGPPPTTFRDDDWMYLPLDIDSKGRRESVPTTDWDVPPADLGYREVASDLALELSRLLVQAGVPATSDDLILSGLLSNEPASIPPGEAGSTGTKPNSVDFIQSENDFIDAYNALTRSTPLPSVNDLPDSAHPVPEQDPKRDMYDVIENNSHSITENAININPRNNTQIINTPDVSSHVQSAFNVNTIEKAQIINNNINLQQKVSKPNPRPISPNPPNNILTEVISNELTQSSIPQAKADEVEPQTKQNANQNFAKNFEEPLSDIFSNAVNETTNPEVENNSKTARDINQGAEKTSNLNDIVGTTQRLIQQMKDEINSDINYIDSRTASQSEADSSSNESDISSEHESSYSDTEDKETDNITSNESESSSTENEIEHSQERRPTIIHRTSSEENDQFEEAMDHIEDQMEDFKHTNIEILDSISRSLQEEQIISVEINEPITVNEKRQDLNNNLFVEVNSFDEIYAELNHTNEKETTQQKNKKQIRSNIDSSPQADAPTINIAKQSFTVSNFELVQPVKLVITETHNNILNAIIENIEEDIVDASEKKILDHIANETFDNTRLINNENIEVADMVDTGSSEEDDSDSLESADSEIIPNGRNMLIINTSESQEDGDTKSTENNTGDDQIKNVIEQNIATKDIVDRNIEVHIPEQSVENITHYIDAADDIDETILMENPIRQNEPIANGTVKNTVINYIELNSEQYNIKDNNTDENVAINNFTEQNIEMDNIPEHNLIINNITIHDIPVIDNTSEQIVSMEQNIEAEDNTEAEHTIKANNDKTINILLENINDSQAIKVASEKGNKSPSKSPPKVSDNSPSKTIATNKSNIPKLVKVVQNNKQKGDKTSPKIVASKVPVRRASLKQYPAPTPPKAHFGNVQSGHVKQLQTRLFNNKFPKTVVNVPDVVDVKPSTSTMHKKKPAPPPPTSEAKRPSPTKSSPPKEKKNNFFRESCRTEDEWTESEAEDAPPPARRESEEPKRPPSPPPPVTLRRVSGQIIDLARVRLPEGSPERQARMLLASGATETWEQARLAVELVARGTDAPAALLAALDCADLPAAIAYLHQDCDLCTERLPEHEMVSMLRCTHRCCRECARLYFTVQITERSIADCVCPYCKEPDLENTPEDAWLEYFAHLDILLKTLLETDVHELFQRKLRDRTLALDPNFRWCMECSSGFFVHPKQKKIRCPECRSVSCAKCRKTWSANHEGLSCEQYAAWLDDNDPERSLAAVQQHLRENGLECPRCHFKYSLSRGGCMHFTCTQCKYEFCYGCGKPFMMGARCGLSEYCAKLGLHAHHPRNCLFYLRDKEPHELQTLLQMNNVAYETEAAEGSPNRCPVQLQRETPAGLVDGTCGGETPPNHAGLCKNHYLEYLSRVVRGRGVDPLPLLDVDDLETLVRRAALRPPPRPYGTLDGLYKRALLAVRTVCPLTDCCRPHYVEYLAARARALDPIPIMDVSELVAELRRRALPLPERGPWDTDPVYAGMCAEIVKEKIPLD